MPYEKTAVEKKNTLTNLLFGIIDKDAAVLSPRPRLIWELGSRELTKDKEDESSPFSGGYKIESTKKEQRIFVECFGDRLKRFWVYM